MRGKLIVFSTITLGILFSFVFFVFYLIAFFARLIDFRILVGLTIVTNFLLWLLSPYFTDFMQKIFYKVEWVAFEEFARRHKEVADFVQKVCDEHRIKVPRLRIIHDNNPTAFCYGSYPNNSRVAVSEGIFKYLTIEEQKAVVGHELGHIINRDFIIMTIAVTLLQVLYEVYYVLLRGRRRRSSSSNKKGDITPLIGLISYALYIIGSYLVLYLSRTREYLADRFSAKVTGNPDALSMALVKIAYGIATEADTESTQRLLASTRALGIYDFKAAQSVGTSFKTATEKNVTSTHHDLTKVFLYDIYSPWALVSEINSTHPLTGKRIKMLTEYARETGRGSLFDFEKVAQEGAGIDKKRLYSDFAKGIGIYALPAFAVMASIVVIVTNRAFFPLAFILIGASFFAQGMYKFMRLGGAPEKTTVFELMQDPYANPLRGRFVEVEGRVIGKADAGSYFGEDVKMQDKSGCLIYLNYESIIPFIGNIIFGLGGAKAMIGTYSRAIGWFRRSSFQVIDLDLIETQDKKTIKSYTRFWGIITGIILIAVGVFVFFARMSGM